MLPKKGTKHLVKPSDLVTSIIHIKLTQIFLGCILGIFSFASFCLLRCKCMSIVYTLIRFLGKDKDLGASIVINHHFAIFTHFSEFIDTHKTYIDSRFAST